MFIFETLNVDDWSGTIRREQCVCSATYRAAMRSIWYRHPLLLRRHQMANQNADRTPRQLDLRWSRESVFCIAMFIVMYPAPSSNGGMEPIRRADECVFILCTLRWWNLKFEMSRPLTQFVLLVRNYKITRNHGQPTDVEQKHLWSVAMDHDRPKIVRNL